MKLSILNTEFKRHKFETICKITVVLIDNNGTKIRASEKQFVGVAKCCPEDIYDFNIGKKIALARAELKAFDYHDKRMATIINGSKKIINDAKEFSNKLAKQYYHNINYLKRLTTEEFTKIDYKHAPA